MSGAAVVPMLSGCGGGIKGDVAIVGFDLSVGFSVADAGFFGVAVQTFDLSVRYPDGFSVAKEAFDLSKDDDSKDAGT